MGLSLCVIAMKTSDEKKLAELTQLFGLSEPIPYTGDEDLFSMIYEQNNVYYKKNDFITVFMNEESFCSNAFDNIEKNLATLSANSEVLMCFTQSVTTTFWLEYYQNGNMLRRWVEQEYEEQMNIGDPIPAELDYMSKDKYERDEDDFIDIVKNFSGIDINQL